MGFQRGTVTVVWPAGHDLYGLEVVMRRQPFGETIAGWSDDDGRPYAELTAEERREYQRAAAREIASLILSWNLEDERGRPIELPERLREQDGHSAADVAARDDERGALLLAHCDYSMIVDVRAAYTAATTRVSPPLPTSSDDGPNGSTATTTPTVPDMPEDWGPPSQETLPSPLDHPV